MLTIKVLGTECESCKRVEQIACGVVKRLGVEAEVIKVTDFNQVNQYNVWSTPGLVIDEQLVCMGRIPTSAEVTSWVTAALEKA